MSNERKILSHEEAVEEDKQIHAAPTSPRQPVSAREFWAQRYGTHADYADDEVCAFAEAYRSTSLPPAEPIIVSDPENVRRGVCVDCKGSLWSKQPVISDDSGSYHPLCRVTKQRDETLAKLASLPVQQAQPHTEIYKQCAEAICRHCREHNQTIPQDGRFVHRLGTGENEIVQWCIAWQIHALIATAPSTPPASSPLPAYLQNDEEFGRCSVCGRKTWDRADMGTQCKMTQPDGTKCAGIFRASSHNTTEGK